MEKIRQKPYHIDAFIKHNFWMQFSLILTLVVGVISNRYLPNFWSPFNLFAVGLYLAGLGIFAWAGWVVEPYNRFHLPKVLATKGPYKFSRNPQSIAAILMFIAVAVVSGSLIISGAAFFYIAFTAFIKIPSEEKALRDKFKEDYSDYLARTRRWL